MKIRKLGTLAGAVVGCLFGLTDGAGAVVQLEQLKMPAGFSISVWARVENAREMTVGDGFVVVGTREESNVWAVPFDKETMGADEPVLVTDTLKMPNGVALVAGVLYIGEQHRVVRWGNAPFDMSNTAQKPIQVGPDLPDKWHHGWRYLTTGPDGKLYVALGSPCNICMPKGLEGSIIRIDVETGQHDIVARNIRNSVGISFQPGTNYLFFTDNGADNMGDNTPSGELNRVTENGQSFGYPWYGGGRSRTSDFRKESVPEGQQFPVEEFQAHTASLGFVFYQGDMWPDSYNGDVIVAQHGSWNRSFPIGYRLVRVKMDDAGEVIDKEVFVSGWLRRGKDWGRPVDVKELPDGSVLVSDDKANVIYRITYETP